jgi:hypothetical protein
MGGAAIFMPPCSFCIENHEGNRQGESDATAHGHKGEPTPSHWPTINSHFGVIDIAGFSKARGPASR